MSPHASRRRVGPGRRSILVAAALTAAVLAGLAIDPQGRSAPTGAEAAPAEPGASIVRLLGVGIALTADGGIWVYRPDRKRWMTIDESFREEGRRTRILPLPVAPGEIREMATWGFLLSEEGVCWFYDIEENRWNRLPAPGK